MKAFPKNGNSFVIAQRVFRIEFEIHRSRAVPSAYVIKTLFRNFEATGSTLRKKGGSVKRVRIPENIAVVIEAIERVHNVWVSPVVSFPQVSQPESRAHLSPPPYAPHAPLISFF